MVVMGLGDGEGGKNIPNPIKYNIGIATQVAGKGF
jgi:hypothetical protein